MQRCVFNRDKLDRVITALDCIKAGLEISLIRSSETSKNDSRTTQVEYLQDLSDRRLRISDFYIYI